MSLVHISIAGGIMIAAVAIMRTLLRYKIPGSARVALWGLVVLCLLLPVVFVVPGDTISYAKETLRTEASALLTQPAALPVPTVLTESVALAEPAASAETAVVFEVIDNDVLINTGCIYTWHYAEAEIELQLSGVEQQAVPAPVGATPIYEKGTFLSSAGSLALRHGMFASRDGAYSMGETVFPLRETASVPQTLSPFTMIWLIGAALCAVFWAALYFRHRRTFAMSLPLDNEFIANWKYNHKLVRKIQVRVSDRISTPLTYGIFSPVILLPKKLGALDEKVLSHILAHEFIHIKRFDTLKKLTLTAVLCLHWFNPLVWLMYFLFNRDIEISCDDGTIKLLGEDAKSHYALTLINAQEQKPYPPLHNAFGRYAIEERVHAIMSGKRTSYVWILLAILPIIGTFIMLINAASAQISGEGGTERVPIVSSGIQTELSANVDSVTDGEAGIVLDGSDGVKTSAGSANTVNSADSANSVNAEANTGVSSVNAGINAGAQPDVGADSRPIRLIDISIDIPGEGVISAEEAAEIAITAFPRYFPDFARDWAGGTFNLHFGATLDPINNRSGYRIGVAPLWQGLVAVDTEHGLGHDFPFVFAIHAETGEIITMNYAPRTDYAIALADARLEGPGAVAAMFAEWSSIYGTRNRPGKSDAEIKEIALRTAEKHGFFSSEIILAEIYVFGAMPSGPTATVRVKYAGGDIMHLEFLMLEGDLVALKYIRLDN